MSKKSALFKYHSATDNRLTVMSTDTWNRDTLRLRRYHPTLDKQHDVSRQTFETIAACHFPTTRLGFLSLATNVKYRRQLASTMPLCKTMSHKCSCHECRLRHKLAYVCFLSKYAHGDDTFRSETLQLQQAAQRLSFVLKQWSVMPHPSLHISACGWSIKCCFTVQAQVIAKKWCATNTAVNDDG